MSTRDASLRQRWRRTFVGLALAVVLGAVLSVVATRSVIGNYRSTSQRLASEDERLARLRGEIVADAFAVRASGSSEVTTAHLLRSQAIGQDFAQSIAASTSAESAFSLRGARDAWSSYARSQPSAARDRVPTGLPQVLGLLDDAGATSRAAVRSQLDKTARLETLGLAARLSIILLAMALLIRLARQMTQDMLHPITRLNEAANQLARGHLTHRVTVAREDELGELGHSLNAMADAIAGHQQLLTNQANRDSLTGLANRAAFRTVVEAALSATLAGSGAQALLFLDLDDFKDVNDNLGHAAGDELLCQVAARLHEQTRPGDLVARLGGDEFALFLRQIPDDAAAVALAERAIAAVSTPIQLMGHVVRVGASIGIAMRTGQEQDLDAVMRQADIAMYAAKSEGKNRAATYDVSMHHPGLHEEALEPDLGEAGSVVIGAPRGRQSAARSSVRA